MAQYKSEGIIDQVVPGSPAERVGIMPGDKLLSINGKPVKDVVGYQFHQVGRHLTVEVERRGQPSPLVFTVRKPEHEELGLQFYDPTFDGIKRCNNHCPFCFVDQNAPGLRRTLDIKDDDYRYSFLYGGFITLTNLKESDWQRIGEERLSPLYVSVHATDPDLRRKLLGNPRAPEIIPQLQRLAEMGIRTHTQLVLCPNINDGDYLDRSIGDLAALYPHVQTVGVVPVGLTRYRNNNHYQIKLPIRPYEGNEATQIIEQVEGWQRRLKATLGTNFVFLSDEWYIMAHRQVPPAKEYEGYPQYENGVGMVRRLLDEAKHTARRLPDSLVRPIRIAVVCGEMPAHTLRLALAPMRQVRNLDIQMVVVKNNALGGNVSCSGLLFGAEVVQALKVGHRTMSSRGGEDTTRPADLVFLPRRMFDFQGVRTLDEWTFDSLQAELNCPVIAAEWTREIWATVRRYIRGEDCFTHAPQVVRLSQLG
jgi:putative radical SAM enzyme (TIGR03279 family)